MDGSMHNHIIKFVKVQRCVSKFYFQYISKLGCVNKILTGLSPD